MIPSGSTRCTMPLMISPLRSSKSSNGRDYLRIVFANEPAERLAGLADRFRRALG